MKKIYHIIMALALVSFTACQQADIVPDTPDAPTEGYHLTFDGGVGIETGTRAVWNDDKGSGNLIFQWDYTPDPDNATESELKMAFVKDGLWLPSEGNNYVTDVKILEHTDPAKAEDKHWAKFETIETYNQEVGDNVCDGHTIYAVTPINDTNASTMVVDVNSGELTATLNMPATFTQVADQEPDFLRNYMYMYATSIIANGSASLSFRHIPATFRFIITNKRPTEANIKSVQVSLADAASVASKSATINYEGVTFSQDAHTAITTQLGENGTTVQKDATYTAYALALPLTDNAAFNGKQIKFTIEASGPDNKHLSFELDADKLASSNPNNEYNWVGGKSYTIRMSLDDGLLVQDITVDDWNEQEIVGGEATEALSSINATAMTPDKLNATVTKALEEGETDITVTLKPDAPAEMITAIRRALLDTEGVADGSINLTLKGVTAIPDHNNSAKEGPAIFGDVIQDENGQYLDEKEWVTQLASINLPDVTEIGAQAFSSCENLISITAPKVLYIGECGLNETAITSIDMPLLKEAGLAAFFGTALTEVYLPSLETVGNTAFRACTQLQTVDLPKLQNLSLHLFGNCTRLVSVNVPAATSTGRYVFWKCSELVSITLPKVTELAEENTFEGCTKLENITLGSVITSVNANLFGSDALSSGITLTLNPDQATAETLPASAGTNVEWAGFTWKEVKFATTE